MLTRMNKNNQKSKEAKCAMNNNFSVQVMNVKSIKCLYPGGKRAHHHTAWVARWWWALWWYLLSAKPFLSRRWLYQGVQSACFYCLCHVCKIRIPSQCGNALDGEWPCWLGRCPTAHRVPESPGGWAWLFSRVVEASLDASSTLRVMPPLMARHPVGGCPGGSHQEEQGVLAELSVADPEVLGKILFESQTTIKLFRIWVFIPFEVFLPFPYALIFLNRHSLTEDVCGQIFVPSNLFYPLPNHLKVTQRALFLGTYYCLSAAFVWSRGVLFVPAICHQT